MSVVLMVAWHRPDEVADLFCGGWNSPWQRLRDLINPSQITICKDNRTKSDLAALTTQVEVFAAIAGRYPTQQEGLQILAKESRSEDGRRLPRTMSEVPIDEWGRPYQYRFPADHCTETFDLFSLGPDGVVSADDIGN